MLAATSSCHIQHCPAQTCTMEQVARFLNMVGLLADYLGIHSNKDSPDPMSRGLSLCCWSSGLFWGSACVCRKARVAGLQIQLFPSVRCSDGPTMSSVIAGHGETHVSNLSLNPEPYRAEKTRGDRLGKGNAGFQGHPEAAQAPNLTALAPLCGPNLHCSWRLLSPTPQFFPMGFDVNVIRQAGIELRARSLRTC